MNCIEFSFFKKNSIFIILCTHCEKVGFGGKFGKQQAIDEDTAMRSMRLTSTTKICIDLNR